MNRKARTTGLMFIAAALMLLGACGGGGENCPPCDAQARNDGYGRLVFGSAGDDSTARDIKGECGFDIYKNHGGGYGDTLEIASCWAKNVPGLVLVWAGQGFTGYRICNPGFSGEADPPLEPNECRVYGHYFRD